jgi:hypothetical protein
MIAGVGLGSVAAGVGGRSGSCREARRAFFGAENEIAPLPPSLPPPRRPQALEATAAPAISLGSSIPFHSIPPDASVRNRPRRGTISPHLPLAVLVSYAYETVATICCRGPRPSAVPATFHRGPVQSICSRHRSFARPLESPSIPTLPRDQE